jgi:hypothetical protein
LDARKKELEDLVRKDAERTAQAKGNAEILTQARKRLAEAQARLEREEQGIAGIEKDILSPDVLKARKKIAKEAPAAAKLDEQLASLDAQIASIKETLAKLNALSQQTACPTCGTALTEEAVAAVAGPLVERSSALGKERLSVVDARKAMGNPAMAKAHVEAHERAVADLERAKQRIKDENTVIHDAESKIAELQGSAVPPVVDTETEDLRQKVATGTQVLQAAQAAADLKVRKAKAEQERAGLLERQKNLENLVKYFGTDLPTELLASTIGAFEASMNATLAVWGYRCTLSIEPYVFAVTFKNSDRKEFQIPLKHLSKSQRYRFSAAFQIALAVTTGWKFVIVDEADIYTTAAKAGLFQVLNGGELDQAIVLASDERTNVPNVPGTAFYMLEDVAVAGMVPTTTVRRLK